MWNGGKLKMTEEKKDTNIVYVGEKPVRVYGESCRVQFDKGNKEVIIKARGKNISKAVSVADFVRRNLEGSKIGDIVIGSDKINDKETGKEVYVSSIDIAIVK